MRRILVVLAVFLMTGCANQPVAPTSSNAYPGPNAVGGTTVRTPMPKPGSSVGAIVGRLVSRSTGTPLRSQPVYLGDLTPLTPGPHYAMSMQQNSSPHVITDADGYFGFSEIKPGTYGLILWTPNTSAVVPDTRDPTKELLITVIPGEIADLGELPADLS